MGNQTPSSIESPFGSPAARRLGIVVVLLFAIFLILLTFFGLSMPDVVGKLVVISIPLWWIVTFYMILGSASSPSMLIADDDGIQIQIWWWKKFLSWQDIDKVVEDPYHIYIYSKKLPLISIVSGVLLFRFRRLFTIQWRRKNYKAVVDMMQKKLGNRFEKQV